MGCCGSKKTDDRLPQELERVTIVHDGGPSPVHQRTAEVEYEDETSSSSSSDSSSDSDSGSSSHKREEREFFHVFFSALTNFQGYQGILRRWEKEAQRADCYSEGKLSMQKVWRENMGYIKSLRRVQHLLSTMNVFSRSDRSKMAEWSSKVVKRRSREYYSAKGQGRADHMHKVVLDEWKNVAQILG